MISSYTNVSGSIFCKPGIGLPILYHYRAMDEIDIQPQGDVFVLFGKRYVVPQRFRAFIPHGDAVVLLHVVMDQGKPLCQKLEIGFRELPAGNLTSATVHSVALNRMLRDAVAAACAKFESPVWDKPEAPAAEDFYSGDLVPHRPRDLQEGIEKRHHPLPRPVALTTAERAEFYEQFATGSRRPRQGSPLTDDNLRQVAELYRVAVERGDPPTQTVADAMHVARSTAARWVGAARKRGFLGPAVRGRGGEQKGSQ
jgi:hypothetical protein